MRRISRKEYREKAKALTMTQPMNAKFGQSLVSIYSNRGGTFGATKGAKKPEKRYNRWSNV